MPRTRSGSTRSILVCGAGVPGAVTSGGGAGFRVGRGGAGGTSGGGRAATAGGASGAGGGGWLAQSTIAHAPSGINAAAARDRRAPPRQPAAPDDRLIVRANLLIVG